MSHDGVSYSPSPGDPNSAPGWAAERTRVAVGRNVNVSGRLVFQEPVRIDGNFKGEIVSGDLLVISEEARIEGRVRAPRVQILGHLRGDVIEADRVELGPASQVVGNISTAYLSIKDGAVFNGDTLMAGQRGVERAAARS